MKSRIVPHGNRDKCNDEIRNDSSTAQFDVILLALSMDTHMNAILGHIDIKGAYLQSGPIKRTIYVRPPRELDAKRGVLWKLKKLPYGISEAGRQWSTVFEDWLLKSAGLKRIRGVDQLYVKRDGNGYIMLLVAKVTDDLLLVGKREEQEKLIDLLKKRFPISKTVIDEPTNFNGCSIRLK